MASAQDRASLNVRETTLARRVISGDASAIDPFLDAAGPPIWSAVVLLAGQGAAGEAAYLRVLDALRADGWRRLKGYDGRASLATFLALVARQVLIEELPQALADNFDAAWRRFERIFGRDIRRRVARRFPLADPAAREDLAQEVNFGLLEDDGRRLLAFGGKGSFEGYVLTLVDRLLIDLMRKEAPRLRLPAEVERMSGLDQAIFVQVAWKRAAMEPARLMDRLGEHAVGLDLFTLAAALQRVRPAIEAERTRRAFGRTTSIDEQAERGGMGDSLAGDELDPESALIQRQEDQDEAGLIAAIAKGAESWPEDEKLYLKLFLGSGDPPRVIAQMMARPVEEVRHIQARALRRMKAIAAAMKTTSPSVSSPQE